MSNAAKSLLKTVDSASKQLAGAERGLKLLSQLTDPGTDMRLLLLSQDTMELRATGGYIGSFGVFRFDHGSVQLERYASFEALPDPGTPGRGPDGSGREPRPALGPLELQLVARLPDVGQGGHGSLRHARAAARSTASSPSPKT